jgi:hypothetical protein
MDGTAQFRCSCGKEYVFEVTSQTMQEKLDEDYSLKATTEVKIEKGNEAKKQSKKRVLDLLNKALGSINHPEKREESQDLVEMAMMEMESLYREDPDQTNSTKNKKEVDDCLNCRDFGKGPIELCGECGPYHHFRFWSPKVNDKKECEDGMKYLLQDLSDLLLDEVSNITAEIVEYSLETLNRIRDKLIAFRKLAKDNKYKYDEAIDRFIETKMWER